MNTLQKVQRIWYNRTSDDKLAAVYYGDFVKNITVKRAFNGNYSVNYRDIKLFKVIEKEKAHIIVNGLVLRDQMTSLGLDLQFAFPVQSEINEDFYEILIAQGKQTNVILRKFFHVNNADSGYGVFYQNHTKYNQCERYTTQGDREYAEILAYGLYYKHYLLPDIL